MTIFPDMWHSIHCIDDINNYFSQFKFQIIPLQSIEFYIKIAIVLLLFANVICLYYYHSMFIHNQLELYITLSITNHTDEQKPFNVFNTIQYEYVAT